MTSSSGLAERNWKPRSRFRSSPVELQRAQRLALFERVLAALHQIAFLLELRRAALLQILLDALEAPLGDAEVGEDQLVFHRLRVARRDRPSPTDAGPPRRETRARRARARRRSCSRRRRRAPARRSRAGRDDVGELDGGGHALLAGCTSPVSTSRRASGTFEMPMLTSPLPRGASLALVMSWKRVVLPLEGKPMRAARSMSLPA